MCAAKTLIQGKAHRRIIPTDLPLQPGLFVYHLLELVFQIVQLILGCLQLSSLSVQNFHSFRKFFFSISKANLLRGDNLQSKTASFVLLS